MDFKALRAARNKKAEGLINSSGGKVDSSDWTPDEDMEAGVKTGARPVSRRAFKTGGKVEGEAAQKDLSRKPRKSGGAALTPDNLQNRDMKTANEEREGKKHIGGFKRGGMIKKAGGGEADAPDPETEKKYLAKGDYALAPMTSIRPKKNPYASSTPAPEGKTDTVGDAEPDGMKRGGGLYANINAKRERGDKMRKPGQKGAPTDEAFEKSERTAKASGGGNWIKDAIKKPGALKKSLHVAEDKKIPEAKLEKAENSDNPKLAKRARLAETLKGLGKKDGGNVATDTIKDAKAHKSGCTCKACSGGRMMRKTGGMVEGSAKDKAEDKALARKAGMSMKDWEKSAEDKKHDEGRLARKSGGRAKGKTNIVINVMPHTANKPEMAPPAATPPAGSPPPMAPPPAHIGLPAGLGAAMTGAAGIPPAPPGPMAPPMARKSGGKVYPIHTGSGGAQARLDKIKAYGLEQKK